MTYQSENYKFDLLRVYSQTNQPDDPEDGVIIALCAYVKDKLVRCWVYTGELPNDVEETDKLGIVRMKRKSVDWYDITDSKKWGIILDVCLRNIDYKETDPMRFEVVSQ